MENSAFSVRSALMFNKMPSGGKDEGPLKDRSPIHTLNMIERGAELCDDFFAVCAY